jgi:hypothetical protein
MSSPRVVRTVTTKPCVHQHLPETRHGIAAGALVARVGKGVEGNQVDLAGEGAQERRQLPRLIGLIIDPCHERVFDGHHAFGIAWASI